MTVEPWQLQPARDTGLTPAERFRSVRRESGLLESMGFDPCDIDELCDRSGLPAEAVSAMLLKLELDGKIAGLPGGLYQRIR